MSKGSSRRWLNRQSRDPYVKAARREGHPSRAHYKLQQLDRRFNLLQKEQWVLELGAAPGGWTAWLAQRLTRGRVVAVDPLPIALSASNVEIVQGRVGETDVDRRIAGILTGGAGPDPQGVDLVLSDMAPNISGIRATDQARAMELAELASGAAHRWLKPGGSLVVKIYQGEGIEEWLAGTRRRFGRVRVVKPQASRPGSRENYAVARRYRGGC
ncbi:MAG: RlmE family RNA methyltransferase [Gammaproteobacteria bacterium]|nr:RlmE family RNA methyltransferase [Gammaproteobacteria bacterium]MDE0366989.1 RlmE family RNA methyltransferase [Gammaproteobacteria bacterium]